MDISAFRFNSQAATLSADTIEKVKSRLESDLLTKIIRGGAAEQVWLTGHYKSAGYRYDFDEPIRILVNHTDDSSNEWVEHVVPTRNKSVIRKYIQEFEGDDCTWIFLNDDDINVV